MKFVVTMNMPSSQGFLVHQVIMEHKADSMSAFCDIMNDEMFILGRQVYKRVNEDGSSAFIDRGNIIVNTTHIGKVQEYYDTNTEDPLVDRQRPPMRKRPQNTY